MEEGWLFGFEKKIACCHARDVAHSRWVQEIGRSVGRTVGGLGAISKRTVGLEGDVESGKREQSVGQWW